MVIWMGAWRVNGNLSVSRAIGDASDKKFVIGQADVSTFDLAGSEDYLVIACDGLWDVVSETEAVQAVHAHLASEAGSKQSVAKELVRCARAEGSGDNITVIVVYFKAFEGGPPPPAPPALQEESPDKACGDKDKKSCDPPQEPPDKSCDKDDKSCDPPDEGP